MWIVCIEHNTCALGHGKFSTNILGRVPPINVLLKYRSVFSWFEFIYIIENEFLKYLTGYVGPHDAPNR